MHNKVWGEEKGRRESLSGWIVKVGNREVENTLLGNDLSEDDRRTIIAWAQTVEDCGPDFLQSQPDTWADHPLFGNRRGERASSFSYSGRIFYKRNEEKRQVVVIRITPKHDYQKSEKL